LDISLRAGAVPPEFFSGWHSAVPATVLRAGPASSRQFWPQRRWGCSLLGEQLVPLARDLDDVPEWARRDGIQLNGSECKPCKSDTLKSGGNPYHPDCLKAAGGAIDANYPDKLKRRQPAIASNADQ
jgi:hypothetical protein